MDMCVCWTGLAYKMIYTNQHDIGKLLELWWYNSYGEMEMAINSIFSSALFACDVYDRFIFQTNASAVHRSNNLSILFEIPDFDFVWISNKLNITREMHWNSTFSSIKLECFKRWQIQNSSFSALLVSYLHFISLCMCICVDGWVNVVLFCILFKCWRQYLPTQRTFICIFFATNSW